MHFNPFTLHIDFKNIFIKLSDFLNVWLWFWVFYSAFFFFFWSILTPIPHYFNYCNFKVNVDKW